MLILDDWQLAGSARQYSFIVGMALQDESSRETASSWILSSWKMKFFDSMEYTKYRRRLELDPWDESIAVTEVCAMTSLAELGSAWVIAVWNMITIIIPHTMPGELLMKVLKRLNRPLRM